MKKLVKRYDFLIKKWIVGYWMNNTTFKVLTTID